MKRWIPVLIALFVFACAVCAAEGFEIVTSSDAAMHGCGIRAEARLNGTEVNANWVIENTSHLNFKADGLLYGYNSGKNQLK